MSDVEKSAYLPFAPGPDPAAGPRPLAAILEDLARPVHASLLQTKKKGGREITFINWFTATRILDKYAPGWQWEPVSHLSGDGQHVVIDGRLGIPTSDYGTVWRGGTGSDEEEDKAYGDASDRAESQALRRAASKFRLCLYLYIEKGADGPTQRQPRPPASGPPSAAPAATPQGEPARLAAPAGTTPAAPPSTSASAEGATGQDWEALPGAVSTPGQHAAIRSLLPQAGITEAEVCASLGVPTLADLPAVKAQKIITRLQTRARGAAA